MEGHLIGDGGYGIAPWLMTPFKQNQLTTQQRRRYNFTLSSDRVTVERVFGQLKSRFPLLKNILRYKPEKCVPIIQACAVLHNVAKDMGDDDFHYVLSDDSDDEEEDDQGHAAAVVRMLGQQKRNNILRNM